MRRAALQVASISIEFALGTICHYNSAWQDLASNGNFFGNQEIVIMVLL